jgi:hypothetical protein
VTQRRRTTILLILLSTAVGVTFIPVLRHGFVNWDDQAQLYQNPDFNPPTVAKVMRYWREPHMQLYLPLTYSVWGVVAAAAYEVDAPDGVHLKPVWFHVTNLIVHVAAVLFCFLLLRRLTGEEIAAALGAALFGLHPLMVEPVAWASALYTLLSGALGLAALWQYVVYAQRDAAGEPGRARPLVIATIAFILALLAKPSAVVIPLMATAVDVLLIRRPLRRMAPVVACWLLAAAPIAVVARNVQPRAAGAGYPVALAAHRRAGCDWVLLMEADRADESGGGLWGGAGPAGRAAAGAAGDDRGGGADRCCGVDEEDAVGAVRHRTAGDWAASLFGIKQVRLPMVLHRRRPIHVSRDGWTGADCGDGGAKMARAQGGDRMLRSAGNPGGTELQASANLAEH